MPSCSEGAKRAIGAAGFFQMPVGVLLLPRNRRKCGLGGHFSRQPSWCRNALDRAGRPGLFLAAGAIASAAAAIRQATSNQLKTL
jgi:hypothetical protein